jgi:hypothetical protein
LVSYGAANFLLDAAIDYIKSPSKRTEFSRLNPICNSPVVAIKNTGSTTLTSLDITYGRAGGTMASYHWTGTLNFLQSTEITLPQPDWLSSAQNTFVARISNPNGGTDEYAQNDTLYSDFIPPVFYPAHLVFEVHTNNWAYQNRYTLTNSNGDTIIYRDFLSNNTTYRDTVMLPNDCYTLYVKDDGGDGLQFWYYQQQQGTGSFYIRKADVAVLLKNFQRDFGDNIYFQFTVGYGIDVAVDEQKITIDNFSIYPNPAGNMFAVEYSLPQGSKATVRVMNPFGQIVMQEEAAVSEPVERIYFDGQKLSQGIYFVSVQCGHVKQTKKLVIAK